MCVCLCLCSGDGVAEEGGWGPAGQHGFGSVFLSAAETGHQHPPVVSGPCAAHHSQVERRHGNPHHSQSGRPTPTTHLILAVLICFSYQLIWPVGVSGHAHFNLSALMNEHTPDVRSCRTLLKEALQYFKGCYWRTVFYLLLDRSVFILESVLFILH